MRHLPLPTEYPARSLALCALCVALLSATSPAPLRAEPAPAAPASFPLAPSALFAQMDDPELIRELEGEESLDDLQNIEYERESMSMARGVVLSLIPGGGFGMMYAGKRAQGLLTVALAAVGYGVGLAFATGSLNSSASNVCVYTPTNQVVKPETCTYGEPTPKNPRQHLVIDPRSVNEMTPEGLPYFQTKGNYAVQTRGTEYDGTDLGLKILVGTYVGTTLLGAILAGSAISEHNNELRKRVESTAGLDIKLTPTVVYDGRNAMMGLGGSF